MGLSKFPSTYQVKDDAGRWVEMPLADEHYFTAALGVGYEVTSAGTRSGSAWRRSRP